MKTDRQPEIDQTRDDLEPGGRHIMNVWQGVFPVTNIEADGHYGPGPAKSYKANGHGLYSMTGNVWEWCWDWFSADYYPNSPATDPTGPASGDRRAMRGGSYLCHASYCNRYRVDARSSNTPIAQLLIWGFAAFVMSRQPRDSNSLDGQDHLPYGSQAFCRFAQ